MAVLNRLATRGCDLLLLPFRALPPVWGLCWLSLLTTLVVLVGYKWISRPEKIRAAKEEIKANILAIRIYKDFWRVVISSFLRSLLHTGRYFALNLLPLLVMLPLLALLFVQMDVRYGMRPYRTGEAVTVKAVFDRDIDGLDIRLDHGANLQPAMNPVFIPALREVDWKLRVAAAGSAPLTVTVDGRPASKTLLTGGCAGAPALSNARLGKKGNSFFEQLSYPAEAPLADPPPLQRIDIHYPGADVSFLGIRANWLLWYILLVCILALALKKRFGVEF
jgi:hypothetical protein